jgi:hypothetical protein
LLTPNYIGVPLMVSDQSKRTLAVFK